MTTPASLARLAASALVEALPTWRCFVHCTDIWSEKPCRGIEVQSPMYRDTVVVPGCWRNEQRLIPAVLRAELDFAELGIMVREYPLQPCGVDAGDDDDEDKEWRWRVGEGAGRGFCGTSGTIRAEVARLWDGGGGTAALRSRTNNVMDLISRAENNNWRALPATEDTRKGAKQRAARARSLAKRTWLFLAYNALHGGGNTLQDGMRYSMPNFHMVGSRLLQAECWDAFIVLRMWWVAQPGADMGYLKCFPGLQHRLVIKEEIDAARAKLREGKIVSVGYENDRVVYYKRAGASDSSDSDQDSGSDGSGGGSGSDA
jgi:hypothetical protein